MINRRGAEFCNVTRTFSHFFNVSFLSEPPTVTHGTRVKQEEKPAADLCVFKEKGKEIRGMWPSTCRGPLLSLISAIN